MLASIAAGAAPKQVLNVNQQLPGQPGATTGNAILLTIDEALNLAERFNPLLQGASAQVEGAEAGITTARAYPNPSFQFLGGPQFSRRVLNPGVPGTLQHYGVSQIIETGNVRRTRRVVAELGRDSRLIGLVGTKVFIRAAVKRAFYEVLRRREEILHAEENLQLLQGLRNRTLVRVNVGEAARLELIRSEAEITTGLSAVRSANILYVEAVSALRAVINAPLDQSISLDGQLQPPLKLPPIEQLRQELLANNPFLKQANTELQRAEAVLANDRALRTPQPRVDGEYEHQPDLTFYRFGVTLPIPIFDRRKGSIREAVAGVSVASAQVRQQRLTLIAELERAYGQYQISDQQVASFQTGALGQANAAVAAAQTAFRLGARGIIEVLDAQRVLQTVRGDLLDAQYQRQGAAIDLEGLGLLNTGASN